MILSILQMVVPVVCTFLLGCFCRQKCILTPEGLAGIRALVSSVLLPVVLFNAFLTAEYTPKIALTFVTLFLACSLGLLAGFLLRRLAEPHGKFMPFLVTNFEGGMLGYALYGLLYPGQTATFAMMDIGQTFAAHTVFLVALVAVSGSGAKPADAMKRAIRTPALIGSLLGVLLGLAGVGRAVLSGAPGAIVRDLIAFVTAPTSALILIIVGYDLGFKRELLRPVAVTVALRLAVMAALAALGYAVIFHFVPFDKPLFVALLLACSLPAPFIVPLYADVTGHREYISATLSMQTILSILLFAAIAAYSIA